MAYRDATEQVKRNRAKMHALVRLQNAHPDEYDLYLCEEMFVEGYERIPRPRNRRGGHGPFVWRRVVNDERADTVPRDDSDPR